MIITIEAPDDPDAAARWVHQVADAIATGRWEGYADFHTNWHAVMGCNHLSCSPSSSGTT